MHLLHSPLLWLLCLISSFSGDLFAADTLQRYTFEKPLMGTRFQIICYADGEKQKEVQLAANQAFSLAEKIELTCSDYNAKSEIRTIFRKPEPQRVSPLLAKIIQQSLALAKTTEGAFDPTMGLHSKHWRRSRLSEQLPLKQTLEFNLKHSGWQQIELNHECLLSRTNPHLRMDFGGIAKGFAADSMLNHFKKNGFSKVMIIAGGDLRLGDPPPQQLGWTVQLRVSSAKNAKQPKPLILANCAVSTSGDLHQSVTIAGKKHSHIIDPTTGLGCTNTIAATVIAPSTTLSDPLATASCISPEKVKQWMKQFPETRIILHQR